MAVLVPEVDPLVVHREEREVVPADIEVVPEEEEVPVPVEVGPVEVDPEEDAPGGEALEEGAPVGEVGMAAGAEGVHSVVEVWFVAVGCGTSRQASEAQYSS